MNFVKLYIESILENALTRLRNDKCTQDELDSAYKICKNHLVSNATAKEIAEQFNKDTRHVHDAINRNRYGDKLKPTRKVYFNIAEVLAILPKRWFTD